MNLNCRCDARQHTTLACALLMRGDVHVSDVNRCLTRVKKGEKDLLQIIIIITSPSLSLSRSLPLPTHTHTHLPLNPHPDLHYLTQTRGTKPMEPSPRSWYPTTCDPNPNRNLLTNEPIHL